MLDGGLLPCCTDPAVSSRGPEWNRLGWFLTSNRWFSHPTGNFGAPPSRVFTHPAELLSIRFAMQGPAAGQLAYYGHSWHKGTQWNMPRGQGLRHGADCWGSSGLVSQILPPSLLPDACARPMLGLYNHCFTSRTSTLLCLVGIRTSHLQGRMLRPVDNQ